MLSKPISAKKVRVKIFPSGRYGTGDETLESAVNKWLRARSDSVVVHDIVYQHSGTASGDAGIASVAIIYGKAS